MSPESRRRRQVRGRASLVVVPREQELVDAYLAGNVSGQVAIGNNILQVRADKGAVVNVAMPEDRPVPRLRPIPVRDVPATAIELLGREGEVAGVLAAWSDHRTINFYGESGIGKTSLLRYLARRLVEETEPSVVFGPARRQTVLELM